MKVRYPTVVADPPWDYSTDRRITWSERHVGDRVERPGLPYPALSCAEIAAVPVRDVAALDAHLYLWTTQRYLRDAFWIAEAWGFRPVKTLVWGKRPRGFNVGGAFQSATEFILFARRGSLAALGRADRDWFDWPRPGNRHSAKPEAFYDLVETISPGPYLELFARRQRLGWDTWGNEALEHVDAAPKVVAVS